MFSGIVEAKSRLLDCVRESEGVSRIFVERPRDFDDLSVGDSVAVNGVCLTVEAYDERAIQFALGAETLAVTGWTAATLAGAELNLERSLRVGDRVHGHFVSGHVDAMAQIQESRDVGGSLEIRARAPLALAPYLWKKGSWALNGVSLTINSVETERDGLLIGACLIPETLKRTNLGSLRAGSSATVEVDSFARAFLRAIETGAAMPEAP